MAGVVAMAMLPSPTCMRSHVAPGAARLSSGSVQLCRARWATLGARRQQNMAPCRQQPAVVAMAAPGPAARPPPPQATAKLSNQRGSPHKVRRVLDQIRGRSYEQALILLECMPFRACEPVLDTLISAAANAKNNLGMRKAKLFVSECTADAGPVLKRIRPRAKGRANKILKPTFHLSIKVAERA